jgi:thiamine-phosphate pyrophosphorylase
MPISRTFPDRGLYAITDGPRPDLLDAGARALAGGARMLQYRDKTTDDARRHAEASALLELCTRHGIPLVINDDVALALTIGAHGVHLGEHDGSLAAARSQLGRDAIIGVSCYDSLALARQAAESGASYVAFGAFFASPTKPLARRASIELLRQSAALGLPRVAIGGITPDNGASLVEAGADYLAVISAVFGSPDVRASAQCFASLYPSREQA